MMNSKDYKDRFKAEYYQLKIRLNNLRNMLVAWDNNKLNFKPTCPRNTYNLQIKAMSDYMTILEMRADIENIILDTSLTSN